MGYNIAADLAINCNIEGLPSSALFPKKFDLPDNQSAEFYYEKLKKETGDKGEFGDITEGKGELLDDHSMWGDFDKDVIEEKVKQISARAIKKQMEKGGFGNMPGSLVDEIMALNKPKVKWFREIRNFVQKSVLRGRKPTRKRENRRTGEKFPFHNPGSSRNTISKLLLAIDTSGSITDEQIKAFLTEINALVYLVETHVIQFDTQIHGEPQVLSKKVNSFTIRGRGGTCFEPAINMFIDKGYDGLIMFTDGYATFPDISPNKQKKIMWALHQCDADVKIPYGKKVIIEDLLR